MSIYLLTVANWSVVDACQLLVIRCILWLDDTAKVSEEVNKKCHSTNVTVKLSISYTVLECHNAQHHKQMDG